MPEFDSTIEYRDIPQFPGYKVANDGSVWTCYKRVGVKGKGLGRFGTRMEMSESWRTLKRKIGKCPYRQVVLSRDKKYHTVTVHTLVLKVFVGPCPQGMQGCHNDGNKSNNSLSNLRWDTVKNNHADKVKHGTLLRGESVKSHKLTSDIVRECRRIYSLGSISQSELARRFGVDAETIRSVVNGKNWKHVN